MIELESESSSDASESDSVACESDEDLYRAPRGQYGLRIPKKKYPQLTLLVQNWTLCPANAEPGCTW